jgi:hypothetical protein
MNIPGITWEGGKIDDEDILPELPANLVRLLRNKNGFILHNGALHVRGACLMPEWHSLRAAWRGAMAFQQLYDSVLPSDIPFAQDQVGDQFLIRESIVFRLPAETGEIECLAESLEVFFCRVNSDIESFLNIGLKHTMKPGQLLHAAPPFCIRQSSGGASLRPLPASEVILVHAKFAREIREIPDGGQIEIDVTD